MVMIRVGQEPDHTDFMAHESFLTARSEFFRRAMNGNWEEATTRVVKLPDDKSDTFGLYLNAIYTGELTTIRKTREQLATLSHDEFKMHIMAEYQEIFLLYVLAEKLQDRVTKNAAITAVLAVSRLRSADNYWTTPSVDIVNTVYTGTPRSSPARRLITDMWSTYSVRHLVWTFYHAKVHKDWVNDMIEALEEKRPLKQGVGGNAATKKGVQAYLEEI
jgi:hypothetical protein